MLAVHDVNVTLPGTVMTPGEGSKAASEVLSPAQTDLRLLGIPQAAQAPLLRLLEVPEGAPPLEQAFGYDRGEQNSQRLSNGESCRWGGPGA